MSAMRILITGAGGMLGSDLVTHVGKKFETFGAGDCEAPHLSIPYERRDLSSAGAIEEIVDRVRPRVIFHAAAMTDVDRCETDREQAYRLNVEMTKQVVCASERAGAFLIFFSTDYIFDGRQAGEYEEGDLPSPLNYYGETKYLAENYIRKTASAYLIFRLSWLYGLHGKSFPNAILGEARTGRLLKIVSDQVGRPSSSWDVAEALAGVLEEDGSSLHRRTGEIYHLANQGTASWFDFGNYLLGAAGFADVKVQPISSGELRRLAKRPANSVLSLNKAKRDLGVFLRPWQEAIQAFVEKYQETKEVQTNHG